MVILCPGTIARWAGSTGFSQNLRVIKGKPCHHHMVGKLPTNSLAASPGFWTN